MNQMAIHIEVGHGRQLGGAGGDPSIARAEAEKIQATLQALDCFGGKNGKANRGDGFMRLMTHNSGTANARVNSTKISGWWSSHPRESEPVPAYCGCPQVACVLLI